MHDFEHHNIFIMLELHYLYFNVSQPYNQTAKTFVLNIQHFILISIMLLTMQTFLSSSVVIQSRSPARFFSSHFGNWSSVFIPAFWCLSTLHLESQFRSSFTLWFIIHGIFKDIFFHLISLHAQPILTCLIILQY